MRGNSKAKALGYELAFLGMLELRYLGSSLEAGVWSLVCLVFLGYLTLFCLLAFASLAGLKPGAVGVGVEIQLSRLGCAHDACLWKSFLEPRATATGEQLLRE